MKAPAYQMYAAEWLADEKVTLLSIAAEGAYIRLLNFCWREGSIPANPLHLAPLCKYADVKVIKEAVALFVKAPGQPGRLIHKRLEAERDKQQAFKDKQLINGKLGGRPRKPSDNPDVTQTKGLGYSGLTQTEPKKRSTSSTSSSTSSSSAYTTNVVLKSSSFQSDEAADAAEEKKISHPSQEIKTPTASGNGLAIAPHTGGGAAVVVLPPRPKPFTAPSQEEIAAYMAQHRPHNPPADVARLATKCYNYYVSNGWKVGRNPMKDWGAACQTFLADVPRASAHGPSLAEYPTSQVSKRQATLDIITAKYAELKRQRDQA